MKGILEVINMMRVYKYILGLSKKCIINYQQRGFIVTIYKIYYTLFGLIFDLIHGTDTTFTSRASEHGFSDQFSTGNFPAHPWMMRKVLKKFYKDDYKSLVDIGCGKGRALLVASEFSFDKIVGFDIIPENVSIAKDNLNKVGAKNIEVLCQDVCKSKFDFYHVWHFFRPFPEDIFFKFFDGILQENRPLLIIAVHCSFDTLLGYKKVYEIKHKVYSNFYYKCFIKEGS